MTDFEKHFAILGAVILGDVLGREAFGSGRTSVPVHDPKLMALLKKIPKECGFFSATPVLKAWATGWHKANAVILGEL